MAKDLESFPLLNTQAQLRRAAGHAFRVYHGAIPESLCMEVVQDSYDLLLKHARMQHHLVPLAERWSIDRLYRRGVSEGTFSKTVPEVVLVDRTNAARSQMAAAMLAVYARDRLLVSSAGSAPEATLDAAVVAAMEEVGVDLSRAFPKPITEDVLATADTVVAFDELPPDCSPHPGATVLIWHVPTVGGQDVESVRPVRDEIDRQVLRLLADLLQS